MHRNHMLKYKCRVVTDMILRQPSWITNERTVASCRLYLATVLKLSPCGDFCNVGWKCGIICDYNM